MARSVRQLDVQDLVDIGTELTGEPPEDVQRRMRLGAAERALLAPVAGHEQRPRYPTLCAQAAALCTRLAQTPPLPDARKPLAWLALRAFLARNGWELEVDDADAVGRTLDRVVAGNTSEEELAAWLEERLGRVPGAHDDPPTAPEEAPAERPLPQLYVACVLTATAEDKEAMNNLRSWCHNVERAVDEATRGGSDEPGLEREWRVECDIPLRRTRPGSPHTPQQVFERNSRALWSEADAMIAIGYRGGSSGVGQELEWAIRQGIPILYLVPDGDTVSRQVEGARHQADITIEPFDEPEELARIVEGWIVSRRRVIEDGWRRREIHRSRVVAAQAMARAALAQLDHAARFEVCAIAQLKPGRVHRLLTDPDALLAASLGEYLRLTAALGLEIGSPREAPAVPRQRLTPDQMDRLLDAAREQAWGGGVVQELIDRAERELALPGVRRFDFERMQGWVRFHEQIFIR
jgi:prophage maintenance system killer protein